MAGEVGELNRALVKAGFTAKASDIQAGLEALLAIIKADLSTIWPTTANASAASGKDVKFGPEATTADIVRGHGEASGNYSSPLDLLGITLPYVYFVF